MRFEFLMGAAAGLSVAVLPQAALAGGPPAQFATCQACHAVTPGRSLIGPTLFGVYGRKAGSVPGFAYSPPFKALKLTWDDASLDKWLAAPMAMVPGTRMAYPGIADPAQRKAVITYLKSLH